MRFTDTSVFTDMIKALMSPQTTTKEKALVKKLINLYNEEALNDDSLSTPILSFCSRIVEQMLTSNKDMTEAHNRAELFLKCKSFTSEDTDKSITDAVSLILENEFRPDDDEFEILIKTINNIYQWHLYNTESRTMNRALRKCSRSTDIFEQETFLNDIKNKAMGMGQHKAIVDIDTFEEVILTDRDSALGAMKKTEERSVKGVIPTPYIGINEMRPYNGIRPGETMVVCARSHNAKSYMLISIARGTAMYHKPEVPVGVKPVILFITGENRADENTNKIYVDVYQQTFREKIPPEIRKDKARLLDMIYNEFTKYGYEFVMLRKDGTSFGPQEQCALVEEIEKRNRKVVALFSDYYSVMLGSHQPQAPMYERINTGIRVIMSHAQKKQYAYFTAAQLDSKADEIAREQVKNPVKRYNQSLLANSKGFYREVEFLIYQEKETGADGCDYLTMYWGKDRWNDGAVKHKYCAYKFHPWGLEDDFPLDEFKGTYNIHQLEDNGFDEFGSTGMSF